MPCERPAICPECHQPCSTAVKHGFQVRHGHCHTRYLRRLWVGADLSGKRAIEEIAECVSQCQREWEQENGMVDVETV